MLNQSPALAALDWGFIGLYPTTILALAIWRARSQGSRVAYFVAGRRVGAWPIALSIMATQCCTSRILGAPATL